jgi:hypothetical protein
MSVTTRSFEIISISKNSQFLPRRYFAVFFLFAAMTCDVIRLQSVTFLSPPFAKQATQLVIAIS